MFYAILCKSYFMQIKDIADSENNFQTCGDEQTGLCIRC